MFTAKSYPALNKPKTIGQRFRSVFTLKRAAKRLESAGADSIVNNGTKGGGKSEDTVSIKSVLKSKKRGIFSRSKAVEMANVTDSSVPVNDDPAMFDSSMDLRLATEPTSDQNSDVYDSQSISDDEDITRRMQTDYVTTPLVNHSERRESLTVKFQDGKEKDLNTSYTNVQIENNCADMYDSDSLSNLTNISSEEETMPEMKAKVTSPEMDSNDLSSEESNDEETNCSLVTSPMVRCEQSSSADVQVKENAIGFSDDEVVETIPIGTKSRRSSITNSMRNLTINSGKLKKVIMVTRIANMFSKKKVTVLSKNDKDIEQEKASDIDVLPTRPIPLLPRSAVVDNYRETALKTNNTVIPNIECKVIETDKKLESVDPPETPTTNNKDNNIAKACSNCKR